MISVKTKKDKEDGQEYLKYVRNICLIFRILFLKEKYQKAQLMKMKNELGPYINNELDSVIIFKSRQEKWLDKEFLGKVEDKTGFLL